MVLQLVIGDEDGNLYTSSYEIPDVQDARTIEVIHGLGCDILGMELKVECDNYQDNSLSPAFVARLRRFSVPLPSDPQDMTAESFSELYLQIAKLALPSLSWGRVHAEVSSLFIGGYGLA